MSGGGGGGYWAFLCQLDDWVLWKWGVKQTILHRCPQGFSVPNRFNKNKSPLPSDSSRSFWFTSPLADTSFNVIGHLNEVKCSKVLRSCVCAGHTTSICDEEINTNVHGEDLAAGAQCFQPLGLLLCPLCFCLLASCGAIKRVFDDPRMNSLGFESFLGFFFFPLFVELQSFGGMQATVFISSSWQVHHLAFVFYSRCQRSSTHFTQVTNWND